MSELRLIVGLGNPGSEYRETRHNAGYRVVEVLASRLKTSWSAEKKFFADLAMAESGDGRVCLVKPTTYMNASGEAVGALARFHKLDPARVAVVVDDADLPLGELRMRGSGGTGGHHGLESVESHLASRDYARLRVGIGRRGEKRDIAGFVLGRVSREEAPEFEAALNRAADQLECWIAEGIATAMNRFKGPAEAGQKKDRK